MRRRSALVAAVLVVTGLVAARVATTPSAPARSEARSQPVDAPGSPRVEVGSAAAPAPSSIAPRRAPAMAAAPGTAEVARERASAEVARADAGPRSTDALLAALGSSDPFVVLDAADDLAARKATRALPILGAIDIRKGPHSAPSVIDALGRLAAVADAGDRKTATDRLLALLAQERVRSAPESAGNVLAIYEALGHTLEPRAAAALEGELLDPSVTHSAKTVVVEALVRLRQPSSGPPLRALQRELSVFVAPDALAEEVRGELALAVERALRTLP